jgi:hypothetical protein
VSVSRMSVTETLLVVVGSGRHLGSTGERL